MKQPLLFRIGLPVLLAAIALAMAGAASADAIDDEKARQLAVDGGAPEGGGPPDAGAADAAPAASPKAFEIEGYVRLGLGARSVPKGVPRDQVDYGLRSSVAGVIFHGEPYERFFYYVHFGLNPQTISVLTGVDIVERNGAQTGVDQRRRLLTVVPIEEVSISYAILPWWTVKGGHYYMPFSPAASVIVTSQMFPTRPQPTRVFMIGPDQGLSTTARLLDDRLRLSLGLFNGSSLELQVPGTTARGPVYNGLVDVQPLGRMPDFEGDPRRGPFRFGLGVGGIYRAGRLYDDTGYEATQFTELRLDAALRIAFAGLFLQGEYLRRQQRDSLSSRGASATGAYVQGSYFFPVPGTRVGFSPLFRYGVAVEDEEFAPRTSIEIQAGVAFYPRADLDEPGRLRFVLQYEGERRLPEKESANGAIVHAQLRW